MVKKTQKIIHKGKIQEILVLIKPIVLTVIPIIVIGDILVIANNSDIIIFFILVLSVAAILLLKLKSKLTFLFALSILIIMYGEFLISGTSEKTEKAAVWLFIFLGVGIIQQWIALKK